MKKNIFYIAVFLLITSSTASEDDKSALRMAALNLVERRRTDGLTDMSHTNVVGKLPKKMQSHHFEQPEDPTTVVMAPATQATDLSREKKIERFAKADAAPEGLTAQEVAQYNELNSLFVKLQESPSFQQGKLAELIELQQQVYTDREAGKDPDKQTTDKIAVLMKKFSSGDPDDQERINYLAAFKKTSPAVIRALAEQDGFELITEEPLT